jgi:AraC family transcriptional regulator of adaptative response/methylated-DNA-[protein]-cysteine methyltransferase
MTASLSLHYHYADWSLGSVLLAFASDRLCAALPGIDQGQLLIDLQRRHRHAQLSPLTTVGDGRCAAVVQTLEQGNSSPAMQLSPQGSEFQRAVWRLLQTIPAGQTRSYGEVAALLGKPLAARAVASACAANPIAVLIPCHRIMRSDGGLGGFYWGLDLKRALLQREAAAPVRG